MNVSFSRQAASFIGAILILIAYVGQQLNWMNPRRPLYNVLNAAGSAILAYIAFEPFQLGFVILEVTWAAVSIYALFRKAESH